MDIGKLTHNGVGTAIITNRFISDNEGCNVIHELIPVLRAFLGLDNIIFIPTEPEDAKGHVDGMVRFMDLLSKNLQEDLGGKTRIIDHPSPRCDKLFKHQNRRLLALSTTKRAVVSYMTLV